MEDKQSSTEDNIERSMDPCGSRNSFIQSLKVSQDGSLEKQIKKELEEVITSKCKLMLLKYKFESLNNIM
jgi:hypothetical protein